MCRWTHAVQTRVAQGSTVLVTVSPPHPTPLESGDVNPPCHHPLILLHQQQCHPSVLQKQYCISLPSIRAPTKFKAGNSPWSWLKVKHSLKNYISSQDPTPDQDPLVSKRILDSLSPAATCAPSPPSVPSMMTMCQLTILQLSLLQARHCLQNIDHQVPKHSNAGLSGSGPRPVCSSGLQSPVPQTYRTSPALLEKPAFLVSPPSTCQNPMQLKGAPLKGQSPILPEPIQL